MKNGPKATIDQKGGRLGIVSYRNRYASGGDDLPRRRASVGAVAGRVSSRDSMVESVVANTVE